MSVTRRERIIMLARRMSAIADQLKDERNSGRVLDLARELRRTATDLRATASGTRPRSAEEGQDG